MKRLALVFCLGLVVAGSAGADQFYKWKDESGTWHYTTTPPKDKQAQAVTVNASAADRRTTVQTEGEGTATAPASDQALKPSEQKNQPLAEREKLLAQQQAQTKANCERAKANVAVYESSNLVTLDKTGTGKQETLSAAEHLEELKKARQQVEIFCK